MPAGGSPGSRGAPPGACIVNNFTDGCMCCFGRFGARVRHCGYDVLIVACSQDWPVERCTWQELRTPSVENSISRDRHLTGVCRC